MDTDYAPLTRAGRSLGLVRAYDRARADFDSYRLTGRRAPFALPASLPLVVAAAKTVASRDIMANSHSRALWALRASPALLVADHDRLDSASATTALGHQFLHLPPRAADVGAPPLHFPSPLFRTSLQLRLGTPLSPLRGATFCRCGGRLDVHGHHSLSCVTGGATFRRHEALVHGLTSLASAAGFSATTTGLQHFYPSRPPAPAAPAHYRPDLRISDFPDAGSTTVVDVTVVHPTPPARALNPAAARQPPLRAALVASQRKELRVVRHLRATLAAHGAGTSPGSRFVPAAWETYGAASPAAATLVTDLLRAACDRLGTDGSAAATLKRPWRHYLSSVVAIVVASQIHASVPPLH